MGGGTDRLPFLFDATAVSATRDSMNNIFLTLYFSYKCSMQSALCILFSEPCLTQNHHFTTYTAKVFGCMVSVTTLPLSVAARF